MCIRDRLKGNLGHLITSAGMAALAKTLSGFDRGVRPPSALVEAPVDELLGSSLRLLQAPEPWDSPTPRRAAKNPGVNSARERRTFSVTVALS